jgi:hypothetical protein
MKLAAVSMQVDPGKALIAVAQTAGKSAVGQERRTAGPKGRRILNRLWPD